MILDTHVHIMPPSLKGNTRQQVLNSLLRDMRRNRIDYAIVIPDSNMPDLLATLDLVRDRQNLFALGSPDIIHKGSDEITEYSDLLRDGAIKGIKFFPGHERFNAADPRCLPYYSLLQDLGYPVVFHTGDHSCDPTIHNPLEYCDPKYIVEIAERFPRLKAVITHYYWPHLDYCYEITKNTPNIYFELAACADDEVIAACGGLEKMQSILGKTIMNRPDKVVFGTDWPLCDTPQAGSFKKHIDLVKSLELTKVQENGILWENSARIYQLNI